MNFNNAILVSNMLAILTAPSLERVRGCEKLTHSFSGDVGKLIHSDS